MITCIKQNKQPNLFVLMVSPQVTFSNDLYHLVCMSSLRACGKITLTLPLVDQLLNVTHSTKPKLRLWIKDFRVHLLLWPICC